MASPSLFLNELSCAAEDLASPGEALPYIISTISAIRAARHIRDDLSIVLPTPLASLCFCGGVYPLATILSGREFTEEWRFLKSVDQRSPWDADFGETLQPPQEVAFRGKSAVGMLLAKRADTAVLSFGFPPDWNRPTVQAAFLERHGDGKVASSDTQIRNISEASHVGVHRACLLEHGRTTSPSSLIYEGDGFVLRMYSNDHNPPHFHVLDKNNPPGTLARYAIGTLDVLSGRLPPQVRRQVEELARNRTGELLLNWQRCRVGQRPFALRHPTQT